MARLCIFCEQRTTSRGRGEHAFPDWLNRVLEKIPKVQDGDEMPSWQLNTINNESGEGRTLAWKSTEIASQTTKLVCNPCNTGWMNKLESAAAPLLTPMIIGKRRTLSQVQQILVATWSTKTVMVLETVLSEHNNFRQDQRTLLMNEDRPPEPVRISVAAIEGRLPPLRYSCIVVRQYLPGDGYFDLCIHTVQINALVLQVTRPESPPPINGAWRKLGHGDDIEIPIFPPSCEFFWPPKQSLQNESFGTYAAGLRSR